MKDETLPVNQYKDEIIRVFNNHQVMVVVSETGSGKSTQLPQILHEYSLEKGESRCIVCTQPRRVAAITIAQRVAKERGVSVGAQVGYSVRFEDKTTNQTKIKYVTDGVLLRECMEDTTLSKYSVILLDEAHERSLQTDILLGLLRRLQDNPAVNNKLKIVVMSATLQVETFMSFFKDVGVVNIPGRQYPVSIYYTPEVEPDKLDAALLTCLQIHEEEDEGNVLVFLPGQEDIENLQQLLEDNLPLVNARSSARQRRDALDVPEEDAVAENAVVTADRLNDFSIRPLYAAMPPEEQLLVFQPAAPGIRVFILATNIAETSVTISGVKYVVDTGFVKARLLNSVTGFDMLKVVPVSKSQANQRAGRAGREAPGKCFRLYTEAAFESLAENTLPDIQRMNIAQVLLQLKEYGIDRLMSFPFVTRPSTVALKNAMVLLLTLGALNEKQELTAHGKKMSALPLTPQLAHFLLISERFHCVAEVLTAVSMLSAENIFVQPFREEEKKAASRAHKSFASKAGDLVTMLNIYQSWKQVGQDARWTKTHYLSQRALHLASSIREQLSNLLTKLGIAVNSSCWPEQEPFKRCVAEGMALQIAQKVVHDAGAKIALPSQKNIGNALASTTEAFQNAMRWGDKQNPAHRAPYRTLRGQEPVDIHPSSVLFSFVNSNKLPEYVVYAELMITSKQYMRNITAIDASYLPANKPKDDPQENA